MLPLLIVALVAVSGLGREATHPAVLLLYRTLLLAIVFHCARHLFKGPGLNVCPRFLGLGALSLLLMLQSFLWNSGSSFDGFYRWHQLLLFAAAFIGMASYHQTQPAANRFRVLCALTAIPFVYLAFSLALEASPLTGGFVNPNYFASFLLTSFSGCVAIALFGSKRTQRAAAAVGALLAYYGMTQAWSRGAVAAALVAAGAGVLRWAQARGATRAAAAAALAALVVVGALASPSLVRKFSDAGQLDPYNYMRPRIWLGALQMIESHPVLGAGLGQFYHASKQHSPPVEGAVARYPKRPAIAHSEYLQYAAETGIPAAALMFALAGYLVLLAIRRARGMEGHARVVQESAILTALALGSHAAVDNNWTAPVMAAGLAVFSLADVLPRREWTWKPQLQWTPARTALAAAALLAFYLHAALIPATGLYFNELGLRALGEGNLETAEWFHRMAVAIIPTHHVLLDNTGTVYANLHEKTRNAHDLDRAEYFFGRAMKAHPNADEPRRHMEAVLIRRLTGNPAFDRSIHLRIASIDRDILRIDPFNPFVRKNLAEALYNAGEIEQAELELNAALELEPNYVPGYLRLADWSAERGDIRAAEDYRRKAIEVAARYRDVATPEAYEALLLGRPNPVRVQ